MFIRGEIFDIQDNHKNVSGLIGAPIVDVLYDMDKVDMVISKIGIDEFIKNTKLYKPILLEYYSNQILSKGDKNVIN